MNYRLRIIARLVSVDGFGSLRHPTMPQNTFNTDSTQTAHIAHGTQHTARNLLCRRGVLQLMCLVLLLCAAAVCCYILVRPCSSASVWRGRGRGQETNLRTVLELLLGTRVSPPALSEMPMPASTTTQQPCQPRALESRVLTIILSFAYCLSLLRGPYYTRVQTTAVVDLPAIHSLTKTQRSCSYHTSPICPVI